MIISVLFNTAFYLLAHYYYGASVALIVGVYMQKQGRINPKRILSSLLILLATTLISSLLTIIISDGVPNSKWETMFYEMALNVGIHRYIACIFGVMVLKLFDLLICTGLITILYWIIPKKLRYEQEGFKELNFDEDDI